MHLLHQGRISREPAGIQIAHLFHQRLQLLPRLRTILHHGANPIEEIQPLINLTLCIGRIRPLLRPHCPAGDARVASVISANCAAIAISRATTGIAHRTCDTIAYPASLASALLTTLTGLAALLARLATLLTRLAGLLTRLTWLTGLPRLLARPAKRAALILLTSAARLTGLSSRLATRASAKPRDLVAQSGKIVHCVVQRSILRGALTTAERTSRFPHLLTQLLQIRGEFGFRRLREFAAPQLIRTALQPRSEAGFIHAVERTPQSCRGRLLGTAEFARLVAHLLREVPQIVAHLLTITDHFVNFLSRRVCLRLTGGARGILLSNQIADMICLLLLSRSQLIGRLRHGVQAAGSILLLHTAEQIRGLTQTVGCTTGIGRTGGLGGRALHIVGSLPQAVERLLGRLLATVSRLGLLVLVPALGVILRLLRITSAAVRR
jgi:hypothetical protein